MKRWQRVVTCLAAVAVFGVTYALILPAITMSNTHPTLYAEELSAWSGDELTVKVTAEAEGEGPDMTFVLRTEGEGADLSGSYVFNEEGICVITDMEGNEIELHRSIREEDRNKTDSSIAARVDYWFTLEAGNKTVFTLDLLDEKDETRFAELVQSVKQENEEKEDAEKATASNAGKSEAATGKNSATESNASKATGSNADVQEANTAAKSEEEKIVTEKDDDGFEQILDGAVVNDLGDEWDDEGEKTAVVANLKLSAGLGKDFEAAVKDAEKNADKRGDAELKFVWKDVVAKRGGSENSLFASVNGANISVFFDEEAAIPEGAVLSVEEFEEGSSEYEAYLEQAMAAMEDSSFKMVNNARFFNITILDADGAEIEPEAEVKVVINYTEDQGYQIKNDINVVHFGEDAPTVLTPTVLEKGTDLEALSFTTGSFSIYGVVEMQTLSQGVITADGQSYKVSVSYGTDAKIPENAELKVEEISEGSDDYAQYLSEASHAVYENGESGTLPYARFFDIKIFADGKEIQPAAPVTVEIQTDDDCMHSFGLEFSALHFTDSGVEEIDAALSESLSFKAESFSVYGITYRYTVDFYYHDKEYHLNGGNEILLSELFEELGIARDAADVESAAFTNSELISVEETEAGWKLVSLKAFQSEEMLTVTFADGESIVISVMDAEEVAGGTSGTVTWTLDSEGTLTLRPTNGSEGTLDGTQFTQTNLQPWVDYKAQIQKVVVEETVKTDETGSYLFHGLTGLTSLDISGLDTSAATTLRGLFQNCSSLTSINLDDLETSNVTNMSQMFNNCKKLTAVDLTGVDTSRVTNMSSLFNGCSVLTSVDMHGINTENVTNIGSMFSGCAALVSVNMEELDLHGVTGVASFFSGLKKLQTVNMKNVNLSGATSMKQMFNGCSALKNVDFTGINTSANTTCESMFNGCTALVNLNLTDFDTPLVTSMNQMFYNCTALESVTFGDNCKGTNLTNMAQMFYQCSNIRTVDLSKFTDTPKLTNMSHAFDSCNKMTTLNLSGINNTRTTSLNNLFGVSTNSSINTVVLGPKTDFKTAQPTGASFLRGTWQRQEDGEVFTSGEVSNIMADPNKPQQGTYVKIAARSMQATFPVTYNVQRMGYNNLVGAKPTFTGDTDGDEVIKVTQYWYDADHNLQSYTTEYTSASQVFTYNSDHQIRVKIENARSNNLERVEVEGKITLKYEDAVVDADGTLYDFEMSSSDLVFYDVQNQSVGNTIYMHVISVNANGTSLQSAQYRSNSGGSAMNGNLSSRQNIDMRVLTKSGQPANGYYIFSAYDIDISSWRDREKYRNEPGYDADKVNTTRGYMWNSEGVYLVDGFYEDTITMSECTVLKQMHWNTGGLINTDFADLDETAELRITGTRDDSAAEASEFLIKADASIATFVWTGTSCGTSILANYQPETFTMAKVDADGNFVADARLKLLQTKMYIDGSTMEEIDPPTEVSNWITRDDVAKRFYLAPGQYRLEEIETPTGYFTADPITFHINYDYNVFIVTVEDGQEVETLLVNENDEPIKVVSMIDDPVLGKIKIIKTIEGTQDPLAGAEFTVTGTSPVHGAVNLSGTTGADGTVEIEDIPYSGGEAQYTVHESVVPHGFAAAPDQYIRVELATATNAAKVVVVDHEGNVIREQEGEEVIELFFEDTETSHVADLNVKKIAEGTEAGLAGATFRLTKELEDGETTPKIYSKTTDENGDALFSKLPVGTYTLEETAAPAGYEPTNMTWTVTVTAGEEFGVVNVTGTEDDNWSFTITERPGEASIYLFTLTDIEKQLKVKKVDSLTRAPLTGAEFIVKNAEDKYLSIASNKAKSWVDDEADATPFPTDNNGLAVIPAALPAGEYTIIESTVPVNYDVSGYSFKIEVTESGAVLVVDEGFNGVTGELPPYAEGTVIGSLSKYALSDAVKIYIVDDEGTPYPDGAEFTVYIQSGTDTSGQPIYNPLTAELGNKGELKLNRIHGYTGTELYVIATEDCPWRVYVERPGYNIIDGAGSFVKAGRGVILTGKVENRWNFRYESMTWTDEDDVTVFLAPNDRTVRNLTVLKTVEGDSEQSFPFKVEITGEIRENLAPDWAEGYTRTDTQNGVTFEFSLTNGQSITFNNLALGSTAVVTETSHDGYTVLTRVNEQTTQDGDTITVTMEEDMKVEVVNNPGHQLPHTGGPGTTLYTLGGLMLLLGSALLYGFRRRHEERRSA